MKCRMQFSVKKIKPHGLLSLERPSVAGFTVVTTKDTKSHQGTHRNESLRDTS